MLSSGGKGLAKATIDSQSTILANDGALCQTMSKQGKQEKAQDEVLQLWEAVSHSHAVSQQVSVLCGGDLGLAATPEGIVEKKRVGDIFLDTGCFRTMVKRDLVLEEELFKCKVVQTVVVKKVLVNQEKLQEFH